MLIDNKIIYMLIKVRQTIITQFITDIFEQNQE
jgi:hypothetical protein